MTFTERKGKKTDGVDWTQEILQRCEIIMMYTDPTTDLLEVKKPKLVIDPTYTFNRMNLFTNFKFAPKQCFVDVSFQTFYAKRNAEPNV